MNNLTNSEKEIKVTIIGAGSAIFGPPNLLDLIKNCTLGKGTLVVSLVDTDKEALTIAKQSASKIASYSDRNIKLEGSTDREELLPGSDVILIAAEKERINSWKEDWRILNEFNIKHTLGENRGPAGLSHTLRTVPMILEICFDAEDFCPEADVLIMTNPEDRITYAVNKYTELDVAGYCDGWWEFAREVSELLSMNPNKIHFEGAGINHAVWITDMRHKESGEDLYPKLVRTAKAKDWQPLGRNLYETYGYWPYPSDDHFGEYFKYACEFTECSGYDFDAHEERSQKWVRKQKALSRDDYDVGTFVQEVEDFTELVYGINPPSRIIKGLLLGESNYIPNINLINHGKLPKLPKDMVVETPAIATSSGLRGVQFKNFPDALNCFLYREGVIQKLSAEAAVEGDYDKALKALTLDPHIDCPSKGKTILDRFLDAHDEFIASF